MRTDHDEKFRMLKWKSITKRIFFSAAAMAMMLNVHMVLQRGEKIYGTYSLHSENISSYFTAFNFSIKLPQDYEDVEERQKPIFPRKKENETHSNAIFSHSIQLPAKLAVFYNAYISEEDPQIAHEIIEEQINKIGESHLASPQINTTIYYSTLGRRLPDDFMSRLCTERNEMTCTHLGHYEGGYEEVTLAALFDYCQLHPSERVVYIHSKGE